ncbi:MAG: hypothetical protein ACE5IF_04270 [Candidatus Bathyarchaeia archaeon]
MDCEEIKTAEGAKYRLYVRDRCVATTSLPKKKGGGKEIGRTLFGYIAGELFIGFSQLRDIVDCACEREEYIEMLKKSQLLEAAPGNRKEFLSAL